MIDDFNSECLAAIPDFSLSGLRVIRELENIMAMRRKPAMIVSDNGTELTSNAVLRWAADAALVTVPMASSPSARRASETAADPQQPSQTPTTQEFFCS